jgi:hypothetical protein
MTRRNQIILTVVSVVLFLLVVTFPIWHSIGRRMDFANEDPNGYRACEDMVGVQEAYTTAPAISHLLSASWFAVFSTTPDIHDSLQGRTADLSPIVDAGKLIRACERHGFDIPKSNHG